MQRPLTVTSYYKAEQPPTLLLPFTATLPDLVIKECHSKVSRNKPCCGTHLQHGFSQEDHLLANLIDNEVLNLVPPLVITASRPRPQLNLPDGVFLVSGGPRDGLVRNISD